MIKTIFILTLTIQLFYFNQITNASSLLPSKNSKGSKILIDNNSTWKDTDGKEIKAQGGCIIKVGSEYNWIGPEIKGNGDQKFYAFNRYTSNDLSTWIRQNPIITNEMKNLPFQSKDWVARPWVFFNKRAQLFVMYCEWNDHSDTVIRNNKIAVLSASDLAGPWSFDTAYSKLPDLYGNTYNMGDLGGFQDDDGNAYLLYTFDRGGPNKAQGIVKLQPTDFRRIVPFSKGGILAEFSDSEREAASIFKRKGIYYYFTSDCLGWGPSTTTYRTSKDLKNWSEQKILPTNPQQNSSYHTQHDFILPVVGTKDTTYIYCGDRWSVCNPKRYDGSIGLYAWFPLIFNTNNEPVLNGGDYFNNGGDWYLNIEKRKWKIENKIDK